MMVLANEIGGQGVKFGLLTPIPALMLFGAGKKVADIEEDHYQIIKRIKRSGLHRKTPVAVCGQTTLHLDSELWSVHPRVRVHADEVVAFIIWGSLIGENVPLMG
jgi:hypothetical protein